MATITITPGWAGPASAVGTNPIVVQVAGVGPPGAAGTSGVAPSGTGIVTVTSGSLNTPAALTGDVTTTAGGLATTLATVNATVGSFTNASITVNAKGLITAASTGSGGGITASSTDTLTNKTLDSFTNTVNADDLHIQVRNTSGSTIAKGTPVYVSGYNVGQELVEVAPADASSAATMPCIGITDEAIANNATGSVDRAGRLSGVNTSGFSVGDELYVSETTGALTATPPAAPAIVQMVATVLRSHATLGVLDVFVGAVDTGGVSVGAAVTGGTSGRVLYVGAGPVLAQDAGLTYDPATDTLTVAGPGSFAGLTSTNAATITKSSGGSVLVVKNTSSSGYAEITLLRDDGGTACGLGYGNSAASYSTSAGYFFTNAADFNFSLDTGGSNTLTLKATSKRVGIATSSPSAQLHVTTTTSATVGAIIRGAASQSANLTEWQNDSATVVASVLPPSSGGTTTTAFPPLTPSQITANQNNYAPGVARYYRLSTDASRDITGLSCSQVSGQECEIWNVDANNIVLKHQDANSTAANRFICTGAADITLAADEIALLRYDSTTSRWRVRKV